MQEPIEHPESPKEDDEEEKQETISSVRIHPDDVFGAVAEKEEFIQPGEWIYSFEDALYEDVLNAAWLEGYHVRQIIDKGDRIRVKIHEEEPVRGDADAYKVKCEECMGKKTVGIYETFQQAHTAKNNHEGSSKECSKIIELYNH